MKNKDKILLGILGAAAAGVAIGLLFYTEEGKKARKKSKILPAIGPILWEVL
ncbi:hypothetical protein [Niabella hibiscisoli]|uniref:hypothetical protein n=1 Tax=Niabella hibiscisoli TaxID=1825928 RepID=UPI001F10D59D|nr:hypothetical protein [Niabella hibiscisoli]MCH5720844.1 hypothetical protein [Niabella hibiscisoli]